MKAGKHQITLRAWALRMIFLDLSILEDWRASACRVASNISMKTTMVLKNSFFRTKCYGVTVLLISKNAIEPLSPQKPHKEGVWRPGFITNFTLITMILKNWPTVNYLLISEILLLLLPFGHCSAHDYWTTISVTVKESKRISREPFSFFMYSDSLAYRNFTSLV